MLKIAPEDVTTVPGISIYEDDELPWVFYAISSQPTFRLDAHGNPVVKMVKYTLPLDRPDGKKGGALLAFDVQFALSPEQTAAVIAAKQKVLDTMYGGVSVPKVVVGQPTWIKGTASLNLSKDGVLVESVMNPAHPSLYGQNVTPFFVELTPEGASVFEAAMSGAGGFVQVCYELTAAVGCLVQATATYDASKTYEFKQHYISGKHWDGDDTQVNEITEAWRQTNAVDIRPEFPIGTPDDLKTQVTGQLFKFIDQMIAGRPLAEIPPADRSTGDQDIDRVVNISETQNFTYTFHEHQAIDWSFNPQGTLPNVATIPGKKWSDYVIEVNPENDPFYKSIDVAVRVDIDFEKLPVHSVDVTVDYGTNTGNTFHFENATDVGHFRAYTSDNNGSKDYKYSYRVNYTGEARTLEAHDLDGHGNDLTVTVGDTGIFNVDVTGAAINFDQITAAEVSLHYTDPDNGVAFDEVVVINKDKSEVTYQNVVFTPEVKSFTYAVNYITADGKHYKMSPRTARPGQLYINGPFTNTQTINMQVHSPIIASVFLDLTYVDEDNDFTAQKSLSINAKEKPWETWSFPVIDIKSGTVTYSGSITYADGTTEDIGATTLPPGERLIKIGSDDKLIDLVPVTALVDWTQVKLIKIDAEYVDEANNVDESYSWIVRQSDTPATYQQHLADPHRDTFTWTATLYLATTPPTQQIIPNQVGKGGGFVVDPALAKPN